MSYNKSNLKQKTVKLVEIFYAWEILVQNLAFQICKKLVYMVMFMILVLIIGPLVQTKYMTFIGI